MPNDYLSMEILSKEAVMLHGSWLTQKAGNAGISNALHYPLSIGTELVLVQHPDLIPAGLVVLGGYSLAASAIRTRVLNSDTPLTNSFFTNSAYLGLSRFAHFCGDSAEPGTKTRTAINIASETIGTAVGLTIGGTNIRSMQTIHEVGSPAWLGSRLAGCMVNSLGDFGYNGLMLMGRDRMERFGHNIQNGIRNIGRTFENYREVLQSQGIDVNTIT